MRFLGSYNFRGRGNWVAGWGISGMFTNFIVPADPTNKLSTETTWVLEREFAERAFLFIEYVGYFHVHGGPSYLFNSGGGYRITPTQQIPCRYRPQRECIGLHFRYRLLIPPGRPALTG